MSEQLPRVLMVADSAQGREPEALQEEVLVDHLLEAFPGPVILWECPPDTQPFLARANALAREWNGGSIQAESTPEQFFAHTPELTAALHHNLKNGASTSLEIEGWPTGDGVPRTLLVRFIRVDAQRMLTTFQERPVSRPDLGTLLNHSTQALIRLWADGTVHGCNPAARQQLLQGCRREIREGQDFAALLVPDQRAAFARKLAEAFRGQSGRLECRIATPDPDVCWFEVHYLPIVNLQAEIVEVCIGLTDITERKRDAEKLQQQAQELKTRNEELNIFTISVAHELKNELTFVVALAEFLESEAETISRALLLEHASTIAYHGRKMGRVIKDLQLLIDVREKKVEMKPLDMERIVNEVQHRLEGLIKSSRAEIHLPPAWPVALGYGSWVEEIWFNYMSNALKYGGPPPRIELGADPHPAGIQFWIQDNGAGLSAEQLPKLFMPFPDLRPHSAHDEDGEVHGLGLYIVRFIAEKLGGQVGVESQPGQGSRFFFVLPAPIL